MTAWLNAPASAQKQCAALHNAVPPLKTARLVLRMPRVSDWPTLEPIFTTDRATYIGGPMTPKDAWLDFNQLVAGWILRGHGPLTIVRKADDTVLGLVLLGHEFGDPDPELGWLLTSDAEGHGYAVEAARAMLPLCHDIYGEKFVSYIANGNDKSVRLAQKLGATKAGTHPLSGHVTTYCYKNKGNTQ